MRELRTCPVTGRVVLINDAWVDEPPEPVPAEPCWYCSYDGPTIVSAGGVRAVAHPVPAAGIEGDPQPRLVAGAVFRQAVGAHELVYGDHSGAALLPLVAARWHDLRRDVRLHGFGAVRRAAPGRHVAWQVFALPFALPLSMPAGWRDAEKIHGERVIAEDAALTLSAWAPRVPFEVWVIPALGLARLERSDSQLILAVERAAERALARLGAALPGVPVDLVVVDGEPWRVELLPRFSGSAALEVASGVPVHGVFPEVAAAFMRDGVLRGAV